MPPPSPDAVDSLILDLLEWIGPETRTYAEVMDAWRTSCPGLPVWEDACERGFVESRHPEIGGTVVVVTPRGRAFLDDRRPSRAAR